MATCLERWLQKRLGLHIRLNKDSAGELLYDGQIFFKLLKSYNLVTDCQKFDKPKDSLAALQKLREMAIWFKIIGVTPDDMLLRKIANKDGMQALRLLYELFVALENDDQTNIMYKTRALQTLSGGMTMFSMESSKPSVLEKQQLQKEQVTDLDPCNQLSSTEYQEIAKLYKERQDQIRENSILECFRRRKSAKSRLTIRIEVGSKDGPREDAALKKTPISPKGITLDTTEGVIPCSPSEYVYLLKLWRRKSYANELRNMKTQSKLLNLLWQHMINSQTEEFHEAFCNQLLQQSTFEKNLALRLNKIHSNYRTFRENTETIKAQLAKVAPEEFEKTFKVLHETSEESYEEMRRIYELHRRIYDERVRRKRERIFEMCKQTAEDLINFAIKYIQYKEMFGTDVPRNIANEWKDLFYKGICEQKSIEISDVFNLMDKEEPEEDASLKDVKAEESLSEKVEEEEEMSEISLDVDCEEILNEENVHSYLYLTGPWFIETLIPELEGLEPVLMITGFIIHRLLETKYPLPPPPPMAEVTTYPNRVILTPFTEQGLIKKLRGLLNDRKIAIIEMPKVTNYCLEIYKKEKSFSKIGLILKEKTEVIKTEETGDKKGKSQKKKDKKGKAKEGKKKAAVAQTEEKAIQVPSEVDLLSSERHSRAGLLGKLAFEVLHGGKKLTDIHLIHMLIEYIKGLEDIEGWVLINYPMSFQQAAMLEYIFGGIQVHLPSYVTDDIQETVFIDTSTLAAFENLLEELKNLTTKPEKTNQLEEEVMGEGEEIDEHVEEEMVGEQDSSETSIEEERTFKELLELRTSKILPRPNKLSFFAEPRSYFTKFINLFRPKAARMRQFSVHEFAMTPDAKIDPFIFYTYVGNAVKKPYKGIDFKALKSLVKIILNESDSDTDASKEKSDSSGSTFTGRLSISTIISADEVGSADEDVAACVHKARLNTGRYLMLHSESVSKDDINNNIAKSHFSLDRLIQEEIWAAINEGELGEEEGMEPRIIFPGDPDWIYSELPVPITLQKSLATIWEAVEYIYLNNLKELFQLYRKYNSTLIPYKFFIRKTCEQSLDPPDDRQAVVTDFQLMFNNVADELRVNNDMKCELHCRVYELFNELCEMSDKKKRNAEDTRREIISQNWVAQQAYTLINLTINLIQVELDRYIDTLQILYDYHIASLQKIPEEKKFEKVTLQKLKYPEGGGKGGGKGAALDKKKAAKHMKLTKGMKHSKNSLHYSVPYGIELLLLNDEVGLLPNPAHVLVVDCVNGALKNMENIKLHYDKIIKDEYNSALQAQILQRQMEEEEGDENYLEAEIKEIKKLPESKKTPEKTKKGKGKKKKKGEAKESKKKKKEVDKTSSGDSSSEEVITTTKKGKKDEDKKKELPPSPIDFINGPLEGPFKNLLWEWQTAVQNETDRFLFRLKLLERRTEVDLDELLYLMRDVFQDYIKEITSRYHLEIKNIHLLINLFKVAIEEQQVIRPLVVLDKDEFFIDSYTMLHPDVPPPPPTPVEEPSFDYVFSIQQLTNIMEKLNYAAPDGIIEDSFVTILEDMTIFGSECGDPYMPKGWTRLSNSDIRQIVSLLFRESMIINWKDFLILGLNLRFPTVEELLDARNQMLKYDPQALELITWDDFQRVTLWFENIMGETLELELRTVLIKEFLFKLYRINKNEMNYAAMLMAFCRGETDIDGFIKALTLARGRPYVSTAREMYKCEDDLYMEAPYMAEYIINQLLYDVLNITEGVYIQEITSEITFDDKYEWYFNQQELAHEQMLKEIKELEDPKFLRDMQTDVETSFWVSLVPYDMALSLIVYYLNFHPLSEEHLYRIFRLTDELKILYEKKGRWNVIRVFDLVESTLMTNVFNATGSFRVHNLGKIVEKLVESKRPSLFFS